MKLLGPNQSVHLSFDLDGTLWNAANSTAVAWTKVFKKYKLDRVVTKGDIEGVAGRPYMECLKIVLPSIDRLGFRDELVLDLSCQEKIELLGLGGELYPGVKETLLNLKEQFDLSIVSNCQQWYLEAFLDQSKLWDVFAVKMCHGGTGLDKVTMIRKVRELTLQEELYYIGDTDGDRVASQLAGVKFIFAEYGFSGVAGARDEYKIKNLSDLLGIDF